MANSIVIIAVICYSTLLYIMDYYGIFIVYYDILLYIYIAAKIKLVIMPYSGGLTVHRNHTIQLGWNNPDTGTTGMLKNNPAVT